MDLDKPTVLIELGGGIGNVVLATPLLVALGELKLLVDVVLVADYSGTSELLSPWSAVRNILDRRDPVLLTRRYHYVIPALPPFYAARFRCGFHGLVRTLRPPPEPLFYCNEQEFYLRFARDLGYPADRQPALCLPVPPSRACGVTNDMLVIAPGCKTGEMAAKRWPHFPTLAAAFDNVIVVGTSDDLRRYDGAALEFPARTRLLVDQLTLRQTAELLAGAGVVVANDSGLAYVAAAVGTPAIIIFGPTSDRTLGPFPPNVAVLRRGMACEPCWFGSRFQACGGRITCLEELQVETVIAAIEQQGLKPGCDLSRTRLHADEKAAESPRPMPERIS
jgi:Glycosyltransferase family 9 (heptosyltransferase)